MRHLRVDARLRADSKVVGNAVGCGEVFAAHRAKEIVEVHEALVNGNLSAAREHVSRAVRVAPEHGAEGVVVRLPDARFGNANDAHAGDKVTISPSLAILLAVITASLKVFTIYIGIFNFSAFITLSNSFLIMFPICNTLLLLPIFVCSKLSNTFAIF